VIRVENRDARVEKPEVIRVENRDARAEKLEKISVETRFKKKQAYHANLKARTMSNGIKSASVLLAKMMTL
jgi:hypothetical protein